MSQKYSLHGDLGVLALLDQINQQRNKHEDRPSLQEILNLPSLFKYPIYYWGKYNVGMTSRRTLLTILWLVVSQERDS